MLNRIGSLLAKLGRPAPPPAPSSSVPPPALSPRNDSPDSSLPRLNLLAARSEWERQQTSLKAQFVEQLRRRVEERGITGVSIDWGDAIRVARDRDTGLLTALVNCLVWFEQTDLLEDSKSATIPRDATAVFHYQSGTWGSGGRVLFNMAPDQAVERLAHQFEPVEGDWSGGK